MKSYVFPGNIEERILRIAGEPFPYMRTALFSEIVKDSERMLLELIHCPGGRVIFYTASGTGAMDAVVTNYVSLKKKAFIIAGGSFGYRWKSLCEYYQVQNEVFEVPFARDIDYAQLEDAVAASRPDVFLCQHHETSTGQLFDLKKISAICRKHNVSLVVDAISSFLSDDLDMEELNIDICITSSQKGLNIARWNGRGAKASRCGSILPRRGCRRSGVRIRARTLRARRVRRSVGFLLVILP